MVIKKTLYIVFVILLLLVVGCSGQYPVVTEMETPVIDRTLIPAISPTASPTFNNSPLIYFSPGVPDNIKIDVQDVSIDFSLPISEISSGEYIMYAVNNSDENSEIWLVSPDEGKSQRLLTCTDCPVRIEGLYSFMSGVNSLFLAASESVWDNFIGAGKYIFLIDTDSETANLITCENKKNNGICWAYRPNTYSDRLLFNTGEALLVLDSSGEWWTITGDIFKTNDWYIGPWHPDGHGLIIGAGSSTCANPNSLFFLNFDNYQVANISTTLCIWDEAIVHFVGWSPNGEQVAFAEGEQFLSRLFVCSSDVLISTSDKSCSELLQGTEAYISASRYYLGDYGGGGVGWFQWLTDAQFIGVSLPQSAGDRFSIGTLDLGGNFRTIYQYPYPDVQIMHNIHLGQDRQRLLYRLDYYDTLHVFDLANGTDIDLGIVDSSLGANWVVIP